jgi:hypothetical protein
MNQNKKKMMKSKLKYYAQVIGVNLLAILVPILAVVLIYALGKLKNIYTHPCILSQEIYDCCLEAVIVVMAGFSVGLCLLSWADNWRKSKLSGLRIKNEFDELGIRFVVKKIYPNEKRTEQTDSPTSDDFIYEDISGLTVKEIWELYKGREIELLAGEIFIAGYDEESSLVVVGTKLPQSLSYDEMVESMASKDPNKWHVEKGYANYGALSTKYIYIPIYKNRHQ